MHLDTSTVKKGGKSYTRVLLRESFREGGKVKKRTIANLSNLPPKDLEAIKLALKHKDKLSVLGTKDDITLRQGSSFGSVWLLFNIAKRIGITKALGSSENGKLALWQVLARIIDQGSRLSAVRLAGSHSACSILNLDDFNEESLYRNLDWIADNQVEIENHLYQRKVEDNSDLFLYDVTSSYLEGSQNELADFGYNRDRKKGKKQIVVGLLCNIKGEAVSVDVYPGNTSDTQTFMNQVEKVAKRFGGKSVTFVGDKGMIKGPQIAELKAFNELEGHYLTSISKAQIETLLKQDTIQMEIFDQDLAEVTTTEGIRYILRKNPIRAKELKKNREEKLASLEQFLQIQNTYLEEHPAAKAEIALRKIQDKATKLRLQPWVNIKPEGERKFSLILDEAEEKERYKLDGCYVLKTDLVDKKVTKEEIHSRYKDLSLVEKAFRTSKTEYLELRPIHVRLEKRTRAHVFVVMLAYKIVKELSALWKDLNLTVREGVNELSCLCSTEVLFTSGASFLKVATPRDLSVELLSKAQVKLPEIIQNREIKITPRKKLETRRKMTSK